MKKKLSMAFFLVATLSIVIATVWYISLVCRVEQMLSEPKVVIDVMPAAEVNTNLFDTSALDTWCRGEDLGTLRMVGAWQAEGQPKGVAEDEQGNLWNIAEEYEEHEFLLLWVADNHTDTTEDDVVVKVWREASSS